MAATRTNKKPLLALDGPSALVLYRDRDAVEDARWHPDPKDAVDPSEEFVYIDGVEFWLSDEDIAAIMDEPSVFVFPSEDALSHGGASTNAKRKRAKSAVSALRRTRIRDFGRCTSLSRDLKGIPYEKLGIRQPSKDAPLYFIVSGADARRKVVSGHARTCAQMPENAMRRLGWHALVPTPEFTFLLLAKYLNLCDLVRVGMELCGHYRIEGASTTDLLSGKGTLYEQQPHTSVARLTAFVKSAEGFPGAKLAQRACRYIADHSASPMETALYLLLCLPANLGGYALPRPALNAKRVVTGQAGALTFSRMLKPDLYWSSARLDMEYDSEMFHANSQSLKKGARRTLALRSMNVEVISMTGDIVRDEGAFDAAAHLVARSLHARIRKPSINAAKARETLRNTLLYVEMSYDA